MAGPAGFRRPQPHQPVGTVQGLLALLHDTAQSPFARHRRVRPRATGADGLEHCPHAAGKMVITMSASFCHHYCVTNIPGAVGRSHSRATPRLVCLLPSLLGAHPFCCLSGGGDSQERTRTRLES